MTLIRLQIHPSVDGFESTFPQGKAPVKQKFDKQSGDAFKETSPLYYLQSKCRHKVFQHGCALCAGSCASGVKLKC